MTRNQRQQQSRETATKSAKRYAFRIKGLLGDLENLVERLEPFDSETPEWGTVASMADIEKSLANILMSFQIGPNDSEEDCIAELLKSVDPEGQASF